MKTGVSLGGGGAVARSLKIGRSTDGLVAIVNAAVAANAMVAMPLVSIDGRAAVLALVCGSVLLSSMAISNDLLGRSGQTISSLRSIGATKKTLAAAVLGAVLAYGAMGAALGAGFGGTLGESLTKAGFGMAFGVEVLSVIAMAATATAFGVILGARLAWRS